MSIYSVRKSLIPLAKKIVLAANKEETLDEKKLKTIRNELTKLNGGVLPKNLELIQAYKELIDANKIEPNMRVLKVIQKRKVRTMSGIANITVLTKDLGCPGKCIYCPTEKGMPKSYLSNEPAMMRAVRNEFSSYKQVKTRLNGLVAQGHDITKIDIRTAGGTWGAVPIWYQERFLKGIYVALNEGPGEFREHGDESFKDLKLSDLIEENETADCRCVGLWVETRPDWVDKEELIRLRCYGVTGIELGIQTTDDKVNEFCKRGHGLAESIRATRLCRDVGLKICHHLMPNLPTATLKSDLKSGRDLFELEGLRPDYLKVYPTMVTPLSDLAEMIKKAPDIHKAYTDKELVEIIRTIKKGTPEYCRIIRIIRDIPAESVMFGTKKTNLRQEMQRAGVECRCVRCREIQDAEITGYELRVMSFTANEGTEHFITIEETKLDKIIGLCRLRFPSDPANPLFPELKDAALIRELHVYGQKQSLSKESVPSKTQHMGFGKELMKKAEELSKEAGFKKLAVISAIGTREYYKKLGYRLEGTYMTKVF
ncbi:tRNA uridine(34) 5-carboxymethylaminomethyl modification radical SAM/GNAT enzyme Elp3 [Patescibacteria group bacterium]|nr:tRNA uridine(34) 5-carboxymethylaminomethyl modification radical SAM/GNAT enzyme Elp3 [Patescibacteria group bacterium]MBU1016147.1 tRNA uridine(34) 5-carboxymethylaminomethyl modification radical SAM/GNAT enzyme Elp3 [Patescibacteria group bacterium]MBU1685373.1 tRNA uridine(34) 5-carboxymethylaminomethyl modification radical SAM/GNAT enzyme Elp3 [Patescibacteria group bacterium]MBU1938226.1 tRNA uridine(34) 5-carboxymethylaminomethyl modification radical SAM/GNAT enzyme Elp3 [Patescibacteri